MQGNCNEEQNNHNNEKGVTKGNENEGDHYNENQHNHYNKNQCDHHVEQIVALVNTFKLQQTQDEPKLMNKYTTTTITKTSMTKNNMEQKL